MRSIEESAAIYLRGNAAHIPEVMISWLAALFGTHYFYHAEKFCRFLRLRNSVS